MCVCIVRACVCVRERDRDRDGTHCSHMRFPEPSFIFTSVKTVETSERRGGAHIGISERIDTIMN